MLLGLLTAVGIQINYHGDFDWLGIQIANELVEKYGAIPWRFSARNYRPGNRPLTGNPTSASWDAAIRPALEEAKTSMDEEAVLDILLADLSGNSFSGA